MILSAVLALTTAQTACGPYTRTKANDQDPKSHCLYWRENSQIEWRVNDQGNPATTGDTEYTAVEKAIAAWQTELDSCGSLKLKVGPRTTSRLTDYDNRSAENQSVVLWRFRLCRETVSLSDRCWDESDCGNRHDCWQHGDDVLAITTTNYDPVSGRILDADIELNTPRFDFTTVDAPPCTNANHQGCVASDIQNALTHEFGHSLGLAHSCQVNSTMVLSTSPAELSKRVLDPGSKLFICETYPKGQPSKDCFVKPFDGALGPLKGCGCQSGSGAFAAALALLAFAVARRRARPPRCPQGRR